MSHDDTVVSLSRHRPRHHRRSQPSPSPSLGELADALSRPALESLQNTLDNVQEMLDEALTAPRRGLGLAGGRGRHRDHEHGHGREHGRRDHHGCGCHECDTGHDDCHCSCCVGDVDLAVYARVGETRIVPLTVENPRKRAQDVTLELGEFRSRGGRAGVVVHSQLTPSTLSLEPCSTETVVLHLTARLEDVSEEERQRLGDVDDCTTYVADLRLEGCDVRPIRIAVVLLPRDCAAYEVSCRCSCC